MELVVLGAGIWAPGLENWAAAGPVLRGEAPWAENGDGDGDGAAPPPPAILPAAERRRAGPVVRLALAVASEAAAASGLPPGSLRAVFGSSNGDGVVVGGILHALATGDGRVVSPTQFHNSVHNAAAGYWCIAHGSRQPATCLGAHDSTAAAALLKAATEARATGEPVLLCCYDHPLPPPLDVLRPTIAPFGAALVLAAEGEGTRLSVALRDGPGTPPALPPGLERLAGGNAAARLLPLLAALARGVVRGGEAALDLPYLENHLHLVLRA